MVISASDGPIPRERPNMDLEFEKAAKEGDIERIEEILATGAAVDGTGNLALTPLMQAIWSEQYEAAELLVARGANVHYTDKYDGFSCFSIAAEKDDPAFIRLLFDHCDTSKLEFAAKHNPLFIAAQNNRAEHVKACIQAGMDINQTDDTNWTALHHAYLNNAQETLDVLFQANAKIPPHFLGFAGLLGAPDNLESLVRRLEQRTSRQTVRMAHMKRHKGPSFRA